MPTEAEKYIIELTGLIERAESPERKRALQEELRYWQKQVREEYNEYKRRRKRGYV